MVWCSEPLLTIPHHKQCFAMRISIIYGKTKSVYNFITLNLQPIAVVDCCGIKLALNQYTVLIKNINYKLLNGSTVLWQTKAKGISLFRHNYWYMNKSLSLFLSIVANGDEWKIESKLHQQNTYLKGITSRGLGDTEY